MKRSKKRPAFIKKAQRGGWAEFVLKKNGLTVLHHRLPGTGVITTNITYLVGSRDEARGETGLAHMLEHMLFKPTRFDVAARRLAAAARFEREIGIIFNANTWKDRTAYFFSYPSEHLARALGIEAERMRGALFTRREFEPERASVLSEFDMYNGDPYFALSAAMAATAFHLHPYGHETIGFRHDIEQYTTESLQRFYDRHYHPNNAVISVVGDVGEAEALAAIDEAFSPLAPGQTVARSTFSEPPQEGERRLKIVRPGALRLLSLGVKHRPFPSRDWFAANLLFKLLADGADSFLHRDLVDAGLASAVSYRQDPSRDEDLAFIVVTLTDRTDHEKVEQKIRSRLTTLALTDIKKRHPQIIVSTLADEAFARDSSLDITSELTEYIAAGNWSAYLDTEKLLTGITPQDIFFSKEKLFSPERLVVGEYHGLLPKGKGRQLGK
jgi:zinc protease